MPNIELYEVWLAADGKHHDKYKEPLKQLNQFCKENDGVEIKQKDDRSAPIVSLTEEAKLILGNSGLVDQLAVPGDIPAIIAVGRITTIDTAETTYNVSPGLTI